MRGAVGAVELQPGMGGLKAVAKQVLANSREMRWTLMAKDCCCRPQLLTVRIMVVGVGRKCGFCPFSPHSW